MTFLYERAYEPANELHCNRVMLARFVNIYMEVSCIQTWVVYPFKFGSDVVHIWAKCKFLHKIKNTDVGLEFWPWPRSRDKTWPQQGRSLASRPHRKKCTLKNTEVNRCILLKWEIDRYHVTVTDGDIWSWCCGYRRRAIRFGMCSLFGRKRQGFESGCPRSKRYVGLNYFHRQSTCSARLHHLMCYCLSLELTCIDEL